MTPPLPPPTPPLPPNPKMTIHPLDYLLPYIHWTTFCQPHSPTSDQPPIPGFKPDKGVSRGEGRSSFHPPLSTNPPPPPCVPLDGRRGGGDTKRGGGGLIIAKKQVDFKVRFRWFKAFLDHVFFIFFYYGGLGRDPKWKIPLTFFLFFWNHP